MQTERRKSKLGQYRTRYGPLIQIQVEYRIGQYPIVIEKLRAEVARLREELANVNQEPGMDLEETILKAKHLLQKKSDRYVELIQGELEITLNEHRIDLIRGLLLTVANNTSLESKRRLNESILRLNEILDGFHSRNVAIWHNTDQCRLAITRYEEQMDLLKNKDLNDSVQSKLDILLKDHQLASEFYVLEKRKEHENQLRESLLKESNEMIKSNLQLMTSILTKESSIEVLLADYVQNLDNLFGLSKTNPVEIEYDTCTEDHCSDGTCTEAISDLRVSAAPEMEMLPPLIMNHTPRRKGSVLIRTPEGGPKEDIDATPVPHKRSRHTPVVRCTPRGTPKKLVKKTPSRRKLRMSMIPVLRPEKQEEPMVLRSRIKK
jgi:predicted DNA-binding protein YlxM (UPF0122 family)